jgi:hypothetical protein
MRVVSAVFCIAALSLYSATTGHAQPLPAEGKFTVNYTAVVAAPVKTISIGKDLEMTVQSATMAASNGAGSGLLHNLAGRCLMAIVIDNGAKTWDQHGYCTYTDAAGDQISEKVDINKQPMGAVLVGAGQWIGGTGKFAGIEGNFEIHHSPIKSATEGMAQGVGRKIGSYKINK